MCSGPLSTGIDCGFPRHSMFQLGAATPPSAGRDKSTSMPNLSRLKSSNIFSRQNGPPSFAQQLLARHQRRGPVHTCGRLIDQAIFQAFFFAVRPLRCRLRGQII